MPPFRAALTPTCLLGALGARAVNHAAALHCCPSLEFVTARGARDREDRDSASGRKRKETGGRGCAPERERSGVSLGEAFTLTRRCALPGPGCGGDSYQTPGRLPLSPQCSARTQNPHLDFLSNLRASLLWLLPGSSPSRPLALHPREHPISPCRARWRECDCKETAAAQDEAQGRQLRGTDLPTTPGVPATASHQAGLVMLEETSSWWDKGPRGGH